MSTLWALAYSFPLDVLSIYVTNTALKINCKQSSCSSSTVGYDCFFFLGEQREGVGCSLPSVEHLPPPLQCLLWASFTSSFSWAQLSWAPCRRKPFTPPVKPVWTTVAGPATSCRALQLLFRCLITRVEDIQFITQSSTLLKVKGEEPLIINLGQQA